MAETLEKLGRQLRAEGIVAGMWAGLAAEGFALSYKGNVVLERADLVLAAVPGEQRPALAAPASLPGAYPNPKLKKYDAKIEVIAGAGHCKVQTRQGVCGGKLKADDCCPKCAKREYQKKWLRQRRSSKKE